MSWSDLFLNSEYYILFFEAELIFLKLFFIDTPIYLIVFNQNEEQLTKSLTSSSSTTLYNITHGIN